MPELRVLISEKGVTYQVCGLPTEQAIGYLECFKMFLKEKVKARHGNEFTNGIPPKTLIEAAQGRPVAFTRDDTRFTDEMMPREFKFIRKKLKMPVATLAKILCLPQADITRFEKQNPDKTHIHLHPKNAATMRKLFNEYEEANAHVDARTSKRGHRINKTSA